jgi:hypothetical protein
MAAVPFCHGEPPAKTERRRRGDAINRHLEVIARNVDLLNVRFEISLLTQGFENGLIVRGHALRKQRRSAR